MSEKTLTYSEMETILESVNTKFEEEKRKLQNESADLRDKLKAKELELSMLETRCKSMNDRIDAQNEKIANLEKLAELRNKEIEAYKDLCRSYRELVHNELPKQQYLTTPAFTWTYVPSVIYCRNDSLLNDAEMNATTALNIINSQQCTNLATALCLKDLIK